MLCNVSNVCVIVGFQSLVNVVRSSRKWASPWRGEPVRRKKVREHLKNEIRYKRQLLLDPRLLIVVTSEGPSKLFQSNAKMDVLRQP